MASIRAALCQTNPVTGDLAGNVRGIVAAMRSASGADLAVFPELSLTGYLCRDLFLERGFQRKAASALRRLAEESRRHPRTHFIVGTIMPCRAPEGRFLSGGWGDDAVKRLQNVAAVLHQGRIVDTVAKTHLATYDIFDEDRYFLSGEPKALSLPFPHGVRRAGISVCEDIWWSDVPEAQVAQGAELLVNLSASPFHAGKDVLRQRLLCQRARQHRVPVLYANAAGAEDEVIFDGRSYAVSASGKVLAQARAFAEDVLLVDVPLGPSARGSLPRRAPRIADIRAALVLGIRDYCRKNGFSRAVLGLSGGADSAVTAALAAEALGAAQVEALFMPSEHTSALSERCARETARRLGIALHVVDIRRLCDAAQDALPARGIAAENLQARVRGTLLMTRSNATGALALACGNKSELATGYCTLYGDLAGGLAPLGDLYKSGVYALARHLNIPKVVIPREVLTRPPTAELRQGQTDRDTLPPYPRLDAVLRAFVEGRETPYPHRPENRQVIKMLRRSEFKRRQMPPALRISVRSLAARRYPLRAL